MNRLNLKVVALPDQEGFRLFVDNPLVGRCRAGDRLRKGGRFPIDSFTYPDEKEAWEAAVELEWYINQSQSKLSAKERRTEAEKRRLELYIESTQKSIPRRASD
jgi:hypothetical protein